MVTEFATLSSCTSVQFAVLTILLYFKCKRSELHVSATANAVERSEMVYRLLKIPIVGFFGCSVNPLKVSSKLFSGICIS